MPASIPFATPIRRLGLGVALALAVAAAPAATHAETPLTVQGSTTFDAELFGPYRREIEERSHLPLTIVPSKSVWGLLALLEGRADVAMISADLAGEVATARKAVPDLPYERLVNFEVSRTRIAFAVHADNPVRKLPIETIRRILLGQITDWSHVGGPHLPIRVVATQDGGGTVVAVRGQLLGGQPLTTVDTTRLESARHVLKVVAQEPGAFGIAQLGLQREAALPELTTDTTIEQVLNLVTLGQPAPAVAALIEAARSVAKDKLK